MKWFIGPHSQILKKENIKLKLEDCNKQLINLNNIIQQNNINNQSFQLENELARCEEYGDKIQECLVTLNNNNVFTDSGVNAPSKLLKNPQVPLPVNTWKYEKFIKISF